MSEWVRSDLTNSMDSIIQSLWFQHILLKRRSVSLPPHPSCSPYVGKKSVSDCFLPFFSPWGNTLVSAPPLTSSSSIGEAGKALHGTLGPLPSHIRPPAPAHRLSLCSLAVLQFTGKDILLNTCCSRALRCITNTASETGCKAIFYSFQLFTVFSQIVTEAFIYISVSFLFIL